jgi:hypothetical protein
MVVFFFLLSLCSAFDTSPYCFGTPSFLPPVTDPSLSLTKVLLMTRHGDRTPVNVLPAWLESNVQWNCSLNMLVQSFDEAMQTPQRRFKKVYLPRHDVLPNSNCLFGQLTSKGAAQHRVVGSNFRSAFVPSLLNATLAENVIYVRSTDLQVRGKGPCFFLCPSHNRKRERF